jgi:hypothetical protein
MTIDEAAQSLEQRYRDSSWFTAVGVGTHNGNPSLFLYVKTTKGIDSSLTKNGWEGYHVEVRKMGTPRVLTNN